MAVALCRYRGVQCEQRDRVGCSEAYAAQKRKDTTLHEGEDEQHHEHDDEEDDDH